MKTEIDKIDNVTVKLLDIVLRMCNISIPLEVIDKIIDIFELFEEKGDQVKLRDVCELQAKWNEETK